MSFIEGWPENWKAVEASKEVHQDSAAALRLANELRKSGLYVEHSHQVNIPLEDPRRSYAVVMDGVEKDALVAAVNQAALVNWEYQKRIYDDGPPFKPVDYIPWEDLVDHPCFRNAATEQKALEAAASAHLERQRVSR